MEIVWAATAVATAIGVALFITMVARTDWRPPMHQTRTAEPNDE